MSRAAGLTGAIFAGLAVGLGAFAAHALRETLTASELATYEVGVRYQFYHALALVALGFGAPASRKLLSGAALCFSVGIVLFSGSIYLLALTDATWPGPVTPLGGVLFLVGWICVALSFGTSRARPGEPDSA